MTPLNSLAVDFVARKHLRLEFDSVSLKCILLFDYGYCINSSLSCRLTFEPNAFVNRRKFSNVTPHLQPNSIP